MTLRELLDVIDRDRELNCEYLEVCFEEDASWDVFDTVRTASPILDPFCDARITCMGATAKGHIRVSLDRGGEE